MRSEVITLVSDAAGVKIDAGERQEGKVIRSGQEGLITYTQGRDQWKLDVAQSDALAAFCRSAGVKQAKRGKLTRAEQAAADAAAAKLVEQAAAKAQADAEQPSS